MPAGIRAVRKYVSKYTYAEEGTVQEKCLAQNYDARVINGRTSRLLVLNQFIGWSGYSFCNDIEIVINGFRNSQHNYSTSLDLHTSGMTLR